MLCIAAYIGNYQNDSELLFLSCCHMFSSWIVKSSIRWKACGSCPFLWLQPISSHGPLWNFLVSIQVLGKWYQHANWNNRNLQRLLEPDIPICNAKQADECWHCAHLAHLGSLAEGPSWCKSQQSNCANGFWLLWLSIVLPLWSMISASSVEDYQLTVRFMQTFGPPLLQS